MQNKLHPLTKESCRLVIFDLDGTLLDTLDDLADGVNYALAACGLPPRTREEIRCFVGNGIRKLIERAVPTGTPAEAVEQVYTTFRAYYSLHAADQTRPYDGIAELLQRLQAHGLQLAVVSNKAQDAVEALCRRFFGERFAVVLGDIPTRKRKPSPDAVAEVLACTGVKADAALYVGDSEVDIETASNASVACLSVDWGFRSRETLQEAGAAQIVSYPAQIAELLRA